MSILEKLKTLVQEATQNLHYAQQPTELYEPINYIMQLGGKRLRPLLTLLGYYMFDNQVDKALKPALAVEIFHNFTLMHDDIMDNAPLRRGMPTVHEKWNPNIAILSGDVMLVEAYQMLLNIEDKHLRLVIEKFNQCAAQVCQGQQWDMNFERLPTVTEEQYIAMIRLKTAALLGFALALGAILAQAPAPDQQHLENFGVCLGIGFQLKDDLLDVYADTTKFGKQVGGDIIANKKTYLLIKALELAQPDQKDSLLHWLNGNDFDKEAKVKAVIEIYNQLNIRHLTEQKMQSYFKEAFTHLDQLNIPQDKKTLLQQFARNLIERES